MQQTLPAARLTERRGNACPSRRQQLCQVSLSAALLSALSVCSSRRSTLIRLDQVADAAHLNWLRNETAVHATHVIITYLRQGSRVSASVGLSVSRITQQEVKVI